MSTLEVSNLNDGTTTVATTYITNGSAKAWMHLNGTGTIAVQDSLNVSSVTDVFTGNYTQTHTNSFGNAVYESQLSYNRSTSTNNGCMGFIDGTYTSALLNILLVRYDNLVSEDSSRVMTSSHGDLA